MPNTIYSQSQIMNFQEQAHFGGFSQKSHNDANRFVNAAKNHTPEELRHLFKSYIRSDRVGYCCGWILK